MSELDRVRPHRGKPSGPLASLPKSGECVAMGLQQASVAVRLPARDLERARTWYQARLGLEPAEERDGGLRYVVRGVEFCLFSSAGTSNGSFTQMTFTVEDIDSVVTELRQRGVVFEDYDMPGLSTVNGIAFVEGNYPSKGVAERGAWFRDSEGNMIAIAEAVRSLDDLP